MDTAPEPAHIHMQTFRQGSIISFLLTAKNIKGIIFFVFFIMLNAYSSSFFLNSCLFIQIKMLKII